MGFIFEVKEPFLFLACILELQSYYKDPKVFISTLLIFLDTTCNDLQHLASLVKDQNLSLYVNLTKSDVSDKPQDF